jgi:hypothetical protein
MTMSVSNIFLRKSLISLFNSIFAYAPATGEVLKTMPGAAVLGTFIWSWFTRPDCRLLPSEQGIGWQDQFGPGGAWPLKVKVQSRGQSADYVELVFDRVEVANHKDVVIMTRRPLPSFLGPIREESARRIVPIGGGLRIEQRVNGSDVARLRARGRLISRRRYGLPRSRPFDFFMDRAGAYGGVMTERI